MDSDILQPLHLRDDEHVIVLRPVLGLTFYLADPATWARTHAREALEVFLSSVPADDIGFYVTSRMRRWKGFLPEEREQVIATLTSTALAVDHLRHFFSLKLSDWPNTPGLGFSYTEIDPSRASRAAVLELTLPPYAPPEELLQLALRIANLGPLHAAVGGYAVRWNRGHQRKAFEQFYRWAHRFVGLDASDPEEMAWHATRCVPSTNWITILGGALAEHRNLDLDALRQHAWAAPDITCIPVGSGLLIRAGERPSVGDCNELNFPISYSEVARQLAPHLPPDPPRFWADFYLDDRTHSWAQRFIDPSVWPGDPL